MNTFDTLESLSKLSFSRKGEAFVESKFLTPLLECIGYESHDDYEVLRHGDDGSSFKLSYPPVEKGASKVKHYHPDYIPTIRKKMFWVIEAKSPKSVIYPFDYSYIVQGLQYCIHPEIQAKYLVLSNGLNTCIYDPQSAVFFDGKMYEPIFEFCHHEVREKWDEIYNYLGVEMLRKRIESSLKLQYEKLCLSSLDERYPETLAREITREKTKLKQKIGKNVAKLYVANMDKSHQKWQKELESEPLRYLEICMKYPLRRRKEPSQHYVERLITEKKPGEIFEKLISGYDRFNYFKKEHTFVALCHLHNLIDDNALQMAIKEFIIENMLKAMPPINMAESALLRIVRKLIVIYAYPKLREEISNKIQKVSEIERFVNRPKPTDYTYSNELKIHDMHFNILNKMNDNQLLKLMPNLLKLEQELDKNYNEAQKAIPQGEREINGFEWYGSGDVIYALKNIACNLGVITKDEREQAQQAH